MYAAHTRTGALRFAFDWSRLFPFLRWRDRVTRASARDDGMAGLTGALIVLPQAVAFATIAGLPPQYGLYAAMTPAIIAALFGSSWHLVSGPTTAISIAVFASVSPYAAPGSPEFIGLVLTMTFLTGVFQLALGLARMGVLVNFISHTVVIGFTAGAALLIAGSQIKNFFGLDIPRGTPFFETLHLFALQAGSINPYVLAVGLLLIAREEYSFALGGGCVLANVVRDVVEKQRHMLSGKPVEVEVHTNPELILSADGGLMEILVSNLVRNAFSYTASGRVVVMQDAHSLTVSDSGKGIPGHAIDQVFIRHFRDMASEGAGIGLSLVKRICDRYGWQVRLDSSEQQGTLVKVEFS